MWSSGMSRYVFIPLITLSLALSGCRKDSDNQCAVYKTGQTKPLVAIIPVIDNTKNETYAWNLSDELTSTIYAHLAQGPLSLDALTKVAPMQKKIKESYNPFGINLSWMKKLFGGEQFVVFLELMQHEEILKQEQNKECDSKMCSAELKMSMRVRVFDLKDQEPKIILQEIIHDSHFIPRQFTQMNFHQIPYTDENFNFSPLGIAHLEFSKEISRRIEDYIILNA